MKLRAESEKGAVIVLCAVWLVAFFTFVALALNVFFLGTMLLQQRDRAEYVALSAVKLMTSPPANRRCQDDASYSFRARCITNRASLAAALPMLGTAYTTPDIPFGTLTPFEDSTSSVCTPGAQPDPQSLDTFSWQGFSAPSTGRGYIILGTYNPTTRAFSPACPSEITSSSMPTAAFVRINLANNGSGDLVMPFISFLGGAAGINFSSRAIAYLDGADLIVLAKDPSIQ